VTKGLTYLVTNDPNSNSTKSKKAREFGTIVIGETEFLNMMNSNGMNVDDL
jgi:DNA ligase (NAD+)